MRKSALPARSAELLLWLWPWLLLLKPARVAQRTEKAPLAGGQGPEIRYFRRAFFEGAGVLSSPLSALSS